MWKRSVLAFGSAVCVLAGLLGGACGGGEAANAADAQHVRQIVTTILVAAAKRDLAAATPHLDAETFNGIDAQTPPKPFAQLPPAEQASLLAACFNQTHVVPDDTTLQDEASIAAALAAGTTSVHPSIRRAEVAFQGTPSEGGNPRSFVANLSLGDDNQWRLVTLTEKFR